jgi:hypothetical protein
VPVRNTVASGDLDRLAATSFDDYSPLLVAGVVNDLLGMRREDVLGRIAVAAAGVPPPPECTGLLWLMRVLFDLPPGLSFPTVRLGSPSVPPPRRGNALPRFPIDIFEDVPFLVVPGYVLGGLPQGVEEDISFFAEYGMMRETALCPAKGNTQLMEEFISHWRGAYGGEVAPDISSLVADQMARPG